MKKILGFFAVLMLFSTAAHPTELLIDNGTEAKLLKDNFNLNDHFGLYYGTIDPSVDCMSAGAGSLYHRSNGTAFIKTDDGLSCNWSINATIDSLAAVALSGDYNDLINAPTSLPVAWVDITGKPNFASVATSGDYSDLTGKPSLFDGAYSSLTGKPTLFDGAYASLTGKPTLFDGAYSSLTGTPTLGTAAAQDTSAFDAAGAAATAQSNAETYSANPANITQDSTHRFATDTEKSTWNAKQNAITTGSTPQYFKGDFSLGTFDTDVGNATSVAANTANIATNTSNIASNTSSIALKESLSNKSTSTSLGTSNTTYSTTGAVKSYVDNSAIGGLPSGVLATHVNRVQAYLTHDGYMINHMDSVTETNSQGGFNGTGVGQKSWLEFTNYNNMPLSSLTGLSFTARTARDVQTSGSLSWNILSNFNLGLRTAANEYAILVMDDGDESFWLAYILTQSHAVYNANLTHRIVKAVGGTGVITFTGNTTSGSNDVTAVSGTNINALTVGMFVRKLAPSTGTPGTETLLPFADGSTITAINVGANSFTFSGAPASLSQTGITLKQYGGVAPVSRTGSTTSGSATITGITNTADLQVNMAVTGTGIPANSYIASLVANTSITLGNQVSALATATGTPNLTFVATGLTGIVGNAEVGIGVPMSTVIANNPSAYVTNNAPTVAGGWAVADGGGAKNVNYQGGIQLVMGGSGSTSPRTNSIKNVTVNGSDLYEFAR